ncbi:MAG: GTP-binding protein, partial [Myxococcales bacterium]|nr:GTP-binding protein [Myxococcales bacterium]
MAKSRAARSYVLGTAGHIDHGKTSLVHALTGVDTDRLSEEKRRGITIELGFAPWELASDAVASIVDVPGHEGFVRTMVAGAGGIDLVILVVSAEDGVMPQTREHIHVCSLLGVSRGVVALTKIDRLEGD